MRRKKGYSLTEVIVSMALIVLVSVTAFMVCYVGINAENNSDTNMQIFFFGGNFPQVFRTYFKTVRQRGKRGRKGRVFGRLQRCGVLFFRRGYFGAVRERNASRGRMEDLCARGEYGVPRRRHAEKRPQRLLLRRGPRGRHVPPSNTRRSPLSRACCAG